jgi:hypothetical protein
MTGIWGLSSGFKGYSRFQGHPQIDRMTGFMVILQIDLPYLVTLGAG